MTVTACIVQIQNRLHDTSDALRCVTADLDSGHTAVACTRLGFIQAHAETMAMLARWAAEESARLAWLAQQEAAR